jgi:hypothetical protein
MIGGRKIMLKRQRVAFALFVSLMISLPVAGNGARLRPYLVGLDRLAVRSAALITTGGPGGLTRAQSCNPAVVSYIVRDESGNVLKEAELKSIYEQLPKSIDDARLFTGEVSFADDGITFFWPESVDWEKGKKVPGLQFINNETCTMRLREVTITYHNKKMRLIFNIDIAGTQPDRRPVIDSLPFQEGAYELDLSDWSHDADKMIPSGRWKKVQEKAQD